MDTDQSEYPFFAETLIFYEDGRLVLDGEEDSPAEYVVIAPGRLKITQGEESQVIEYEIVEGMLQLFIEGEVVQFSQVSTPLTVAQSTSESLATSSPTVEIAILIPSMTPTLFMPTNTVVLPTATQTLTATLPAPSETPTLSLEEKYVDYKINSKDGMPLLYVSEGEFLMGSNEDEDPYFWGAEGPAHDVYVDAFWVYQTEVTNAMYQQCVAEKACPKPLRNESRTVEDYYINERYADYPVIQVNWVDATAYCVWAGGRLPTEAEWEKAARGTDGRTFPWGDTGLTPELASFCGSNCLGQERERIDDDYIEIAPVGMFPAGASPYGALDMAGNVWEWVFDYFEPLYYVSSPYDNPRGPLNGDRRVIRGGSWFNPLDGLRTAARTSLPPRDGLDTVGFRCVVDVE